MLARIQLLSVVSIGLASVATLGVACGGSGRPRAPSEPAPVLEASHPSPSTQPAALASSAPRSTATASAVSSAIRVASAVPAAPTCPATMTGIPGGAFSATFVGSKGTSASLQPFCLDRDEVKVDAFSKCVQAKACKEPKAHANNLGDWAQFCNWRHPASRGDHPINCVNWSQATEYCAWEGGRLPSEQEWWWAARGGSAARKHPWGDDAFDEKKLNACGAECLANLKAKMPKETYVTTLFSASDGYPETAPVSHYGAQVFGLADIEGNVSEWTSSTSTLGDSFKVMCGSSWTSNSVEDHAHMDDASDRNPTIGFRCARTP